MTSAIVLLPVERSQETAARALRAALTALALASCGGTTEASSSPGLSNDAGAEAEAGAADVTGPEVNLPEGSEAAGGSSGACNFEEGKARYLVATARPSDAGTCPAASSFDGAASVQGATETALSLSFGGGCNLSISSEVPVELEQEYDSWTLPAIEQGATLWLTWRYGMGQPYSGEFHRGFALRAAQDGPLILASQYSTDSDPDAMLASASDFGPQMVADAQGQCTEFIGAYGCYVDVRRTWHSVDLTADQPVTVPSRASRELTIGGKPYVLAVAGVHGETGTYNQTCADGPTLSGRVEWTLWQKP
jgi:hypothetical protein